MNRGFRLLQILPLVVATALRVRRLRHICDIRLVAAQLRRGPPLPPRLRDPELLAIGTDALAAWLPPWGMGRCLKRSLILLELWSRCGLEPRLHVGMRRAPHGGWEGHAWLSTAGGSPPAPAYAELAVA